jgi:hypothetical protein
LRRVVYRRAQVYFRRVFVVVVRNRELIHGKVFRENPLITEASFVLAFHLNPQGFCKKKKKTHLPTAVHFLFYYQPRRRLLSHNR